jgi:hypothetical protein
VVNGQVEKVVHKGDREFVLHGDVSNNKLLDKLLMDSFGEKQQPLPQQKLQPPQQQQVVARKPVATQVAKALLPPTQSLRVAAHTPTPSVATSSSSSRRNCFPKKVLLKGLSLNADNRLPDKMLSRNLVIGKHCFQSTNMTVELAS